MPPSCRVLVVLAFLTPALLLAQDSASVAARKISKINRSLRRVWGTHNDNIVWGAAAFGMGGIH